MAKVFCVFLLACVATALGQFHHYYPSPYYGLGGIGFGVFGGQQNVNNGQQGGSLYGQAFVGQQRPNFGGQFNDDSGPAYYDFDYRVSDPFGSHVEFGHQEQRRGYDTQGNYHVVLPDGRLQHVAYTADQDGYKPVVSYYGNPNGFGNGAGNNQGSNDDRALGNSFGGNFGNGRIGHF